MTLWTLLQAIVLGVNGLAVLNNERFLEKRGWGFSQLGGSNVMGHGPSALKQQIIGVLHAAQYMRMPLIFINITIVLVKLIFG